MTEDIVHESTHKSPLQWIFAVVALLMLAAAAYLFFQNKTLQNTIAQIETERLQLKQQEQNLQQQLASEKSAEEKVKDELARTQKDLKRVERKVAIYEKEAKKEDVPKDVKIIPLNLTSQTRAGNIHLLSLSKEVDYVSVTLQLEGSEFTEYQVSLKDPNTGKDLWKSSILKPHDRTLQFGLPAKVLNDEEYVFELAGIGEEDTPQVISGYPFRVIIE